jgi:hypothetical protein
MYVVVVGNNRKTVRALVRSSNGSPRDEVFLVAGLSKKGGKAVTGRPPNNRSSNNNQLGKAKQTKAKQSKSCKRPPTMFVHHGWLVVSNRGGRRSNVGRVSVSQREGQCSI